jgi:hypothetical protein
MCKLLSIGVKNEPTIKFDTNFWDNPLMSIDIYVATQFEHFDWAFVVLK